MSPKRHAPATLRNREPILAVLAPLLDGPRRVLEVASGSGEHAVFFASRLPGVTWQPSDASPDARASIEAHRAETGLANLLAPIALDAESDDWPIAEAGAVVCINMIHIAPIEATFGLLRGAARVLGEGAPLYLYGPFKRGGAHTAESNARFDEDLRARNPAWGVRSVEDVIARAEREGLVHEATLEMPANNLSVVLRRR